MPQKLVCPALAVALLCCALAGPTRAAEGSVTRKARLEGHYGYQVESDGEADPAFVQTDFGSRERGARFSWLAKGKRLRFAAETPTGTRVVIARAVSGRNVLKVRKAAWEISLEKTATSTVPVLTLRVYEQGGRNTDFGLGRAKKKALIEVLWMAARTPSSNDGAITVLRNGNEQAVATDLDNRFRLRSFAIGMLDGSEWIEKKSKLFLDRVWITRL